MAKISGSYLQVAISAPLSPPPPTYSRVHGSWLQIALVAPLTTVVTSGGGPMATHNPNIIINITLDSAPIPAVSFTKSLMLVPKATNSLNGNRVVEYTSTREAQADQTAGYISVGTMAGITAYFSQIPTAQSLLVGNIDLAAMTPETIAQAIAAIQLLRDDWYALYIWSRADADIVAASTVIEAMRKIFIFQSDDTSWLDAGLPSGLTALAGRERTIGVFHTTDAQWLDAGWLASRIVFDPDVQSASWEGPVRGVVAYSPGITQAQRTAGIANNINILLSYGAASTLYVDPGVNMSGRQISEIVTSDWLYYRLQNLVAQTKIDMDARGQKFYLNDDGQVLGLGLVDAVLQDGVNKEHFVPKQVYSSAPPILSSDISARQLRFRAWGQLLGSARQFQYDINLSRNPVLI